MSFVNYVKVRVGSEFTTTDTNLNVLKAVSPYNEPPVSGKLTLMDSLANPQKIEIITYTGRVDMTTYWTLTGISRGQENTVVSDFYLGQYVMQLFTAADAANVASNTEEVEEVQENLETLEESRGTMDLDGGHF